MTEEIGSERYLWFLFFLLFGGEKSGESFFAGWLSWAISRKWLLKQPWKPSIIWNSAIWFDPSLAVLQSPGG